ncbi:MAG TPA: hypothetical protein VKR27_00180 [Acidimicrobiales bacterium]|nr:hypothetical protein [Acidimicrobiales bacterium]
MGILSRNLLHLRATSVLAASVIAIPVLLSACSSSPSAKSGNTAAVKANWTTFFKGSTPAAKKISLLQDGSKFASYIEAQAKSAEARAVSVKVKSVRFTSNTTAKVSYAILIGGTTGLPSASGTAVLEGTTWKVSDTSFCALLSLESAKVSGCPG